MLLTYVSALKLFRNPLERVRTYSRDRYGAALTPTGFRGLLISATGRRLMDHVDIEDYLLQSRKYGGLWSNVNVLFEPEPQVFLRINQLRAAGYSYKPRQENCGETRRGLNAKLLGLRDATIDNDFDGRGLCEDCGRKHNESQDERSHECDEKHGK